MRPRPFLPTAALMVLSVLVSPISAQNLAPPAALPFLRSGEFMSGDMILEAAQLLRRPTDRWQGAAEALDVYRALPWPGGLLPVVFEGGITADRQQLFFRACRLWDAFTGVRCVPRTDEAVYVRVVTTEGAGCSAHTGRQTGGIGGIFLSQEDCWQPGTIAHEVGHAFGLIHEHQRADRDNYIDVDSSAIREGSESAFSRLTSQRLATDYDFESIMHYGPLSFARDSAHPTILAKPQFADRAKNMGQRGAPTALDRQVLAALYNLPPALPRTGTVPAFSRIDFLNAMEDLDVVYRDELRRRDGLSINQRPDFLGIAAWIFDVYLASRATGYTQGEAFYNVRAWISQSEEWRVNNPGLSPMPPAPIRSPIQLDRGEYLLAMERLDEAYRTELLRSNGLSIGGRPDFLGIAAWIFDVYLNSRLRGASPDQAWASVLSAIRASDEYRQRH